MARAPERTPPVNHDDDELWSAHLGGETPDDATTQEMKLAHRAVGKFPELAERYKGFAGPAAVASGALIVLAGVAIARRMRKGQKPEEILAEITSDEIEQAATVTSRQNVLRRMIQRVARRRRKAEEAESAAR
jgi:hypothetical protein